MLMMMMLHSPSEDNTMKIKEYTSASGVKVRPMTGSFRAWRHLSAETNRVFEMPETGECPFCGGWLSWRDLEGYGEVWCICQVLKFSERYKLMHGMFASPMEEKTLAQIEPWGNSAFRNGLMATVNHMEEWLKWPERWVLLLGTNGIGKTHILQSLARALEPWSLYITASDFESRLYQGLSDESNYSVETFLHVVSHAPFLFLDDLGTEYGSKFPKAALRRVVDYRYLRPSEYVTVIASNKTPRELTQFDMRIGDRLLDDHIGDSYQITYDKSWRRHAGTY